MHVHVHEEILDEVVPDERVIPEKDKRSRNCISFLWRNTLQPAISLCLIGKTSLSDVNLFLYILRV